MIPTRGPQTSVFKQAGRAGRQGQAGRQAGAGRGRQGQAGRDGTPLPDGPRIVRGWQAPVWGALLGRLGEGVRTSQVRTPIRKRSLGNHMETI